jgi:SAM-dependent methyltransferase
LHARAEALFVRHVLEKVRLENVGALLDLGGGAGTYLIAFCRRWPTIQGTLLDLPASIRIAREIIGKADVHKRVTFLEADYRKDGLGGPYDAAFVSNVVHTESESSLRDLLKKLHQTLNPGGRLILRDMFLNEDRTGPSGALFSLNMLLNTDGGRCYSLHEMDGFLKDAGFGRIRVLEPYSLLEARKAGELPQREPKEIPSGLKLVAADEPVSESDEEPPREDARSEDSSESDSEPANETEPVDASADEGSDSTHEPTGSG